MEPFELARFVTAQDAGHTYKHALDELRAGQKTSHWMWFVFPQIAGLGRSSMAKQYAIASLEEARAYAEHPVLGARLRICVATLNALSVTNAKTIFGSVDAMKLQSSLTLFTRAVPDEESFRRALDRFFGGVLDAATTQRRRDRGSATRLFQRHDVDGDRGRNGHGGDGVRTPRLGARLELLVAQLQA